MTDFVKYHALGNDYLVIDPRHLDCAQTGEVAKRLCDRHTGVGADGVLFGPIGSVESGRPVELSIFNSDGTPCEKSANGIRIFVLYLAENYLNDTEFTVRTVAGDSRVRIQDVENGVVRIDMGRASFDAATIGVVGLSGPAVNWSLDLDGRSLTVTSVHNGNPHTVVRMDDVSRQVAEDLGPAIAGHPRFPQRTNVQFMRVVDRGRIQIEIWERGAGYTLASGASSCAAAAVARELGLVDDTVEVSMPGGVLKTFFDPAGAVHLTGVVEKVASGDLSHLLRSRVTGPKAPTARVLDQVGVA